MMRVPQKVESLTYIPGTSIEMILKITPFKEPVFCLNMYKNDLLVMKEKVTICSNKVKPHTAGIARSASNIQSYS